MHSDDFFWINAVGMTGETLAACAVCLVGWLKGGSAARAASLAFGIGWIGWSVVSLAAPNLNDQLFPALLWDIWVALAFLYLAIRYNSLWIGAAMIAQGFQLGFRALDVILPEARHSIVHLSLVVAINALNLAMMAMLIGATLTERGRLSRARRTRSSPTGDELPAS